MLINTHDNIESWGSKEEFCRSKTPHTIQGIFHIISQKKLAFTNCLCKVYYYLL